MGVPSPRPDLFVVVRILEALQAHPEGVRKTPLQLASGVNYTVFVRYLNRLSEQRLVEMHVDGGGVELVLPTARGTDALRFLQEGISRVTGAARDD